jgi:hypothetical protein
MCICIVYFNMGLGLWCLMPLSTMFTLYFNCICCVMVSIFVLGVVHHWFEPQLDQSSDYKIWICCFPTKHWALRWPFLTDRPVTTILSSGLNIQSVLKVKKNSFNLCECFKISWKKINKQNDLQPFNHAHFMKLFLNVMTTNNYAQ